MTHKHLSEEQIQRMIASDPDAPEATDEQLAQAKPFAEVFPALADAMRQNVGGRPRLENRNVAAPLRLDQVVVEQFKATSAGWHRLRQSHQWLYPADDDH